MLLRPNSVYTQECIQATAGAKTLKVEDDNVTQETSILH